MEILNHIFKEAGVSEESISAIMANEAFKSITIPDDVTSKVKSSLVNIERAKEIPDIANHFKGTHFGLIDDATKGALKGLGIADDEINAIFNKGKTADRIVEAIKKAKEVGSKKASAGTNEQLEELRGLLKQRETETEAIKNEYEGKLNSQIQAYNQLQYDNALSGAIASTGLKFVALPNDVLKVSANHIISSKLAEIKAKPVIENGKISLVMASDETQPHFVGTEKTDFYKLLPTWLESLVDKSNGTTNSNTPIIGEQRNLSRAQQAAASNLASIKLID